MSATGGALLTILGILPGGGAALAWGGEDFTPQGGQLLNLARQLHNSQPNCICHRVHDMHGIVRFDHLATCVVQGCNKSDRQSSAQTAHYGRGA
jgi:hypothetical protein